MYTGGHIGTLHPWALAWKSRSRSSASEAFHVAIALAISTKESTATRRIACGEAGKAYCSTQSTASVYTMSLSACAQRQQA